MTFLEKAYGFRTKRVNFYHIKIWHEEFEGVFDWYHTTGTVIVHTEKYTSNIGSYGDEENLALRIINYVSKKTVENFRN